MKRLLCVLICLMLMLTAALGEGSPVLEDRGTDASCGSLHYPELTGMADTEKQTALNAILQETGHVTEIADRWVYLIGTELKADLAWRADEDALQGGIVSCVFMAQGMIAGDVRSSQRNTACVLDTVSGEPVTMDALFTDPAAAEEHIAEYIDWDVLPAMNAHVIAGNLTQLPSDYSVDVQGITFWYVIDDFRMLSDRAGSIRVPWQALSDLLLTGEDTVLRRIGAEEMLSGSEQAAERIAECVAEGVLPGIPAVMGDDMASLVDTHRLLNDPDLMAGGRIFALEDSRFRNVLIVTDSVTEEWDNSVVQGIRTDEYSLFGLTTGVTARDDWQALLGQPFASLVLDEETAESQCLVPGTSDYYVYGEHRLRLHADEDGILSTIWLN